jgi:hypothetical protein
LELDQVCQRLVSFKGWEVETETEVCMRCNIDDLENMLRLQTVGNFKVCSIVPGNCTTKLARFIEAETNAHRDVCKIWKAVHSVVEVCSDRLDLGDAE